MSIRIKFRPKINQNCILQLVEKKLNRFHSVLNCTGFGAVLHGAKQLIPSGMGFMQQGSFVIKPNTTAIAMKTKYKITISFILKISDRVISTSDQVLWRSAYLYHMHLDIRCLKLNSFTSFESLRVIVSNTTSLMKNAFANVQQYLNCNDSMYVVKYDKSCMLFQR